MLKRNSSFEYELDLNLRGQLLERDKFPGKKIRGSSLIRKGREYYTMLEFNDGSVSQIEEGTMESIARKNYRELVISMEEGEVRTSSMGSFIYDPFTESLFSNS